LYALESGFDEYAVRKKLMRIYEENEDYVALADDLEALLAITGDEAIEDDKERLELYTALVHTILRNLDEPDRARSTARDARREFGDVPVVLGLLGQTSAAIGDEEQAKLLLESAVEEDPALAFVWLALAQLREQESDQEGAIEAYRKAYQLALGSDQDIVERAARRHNTLVDNGETP
jgi:predicted Zn-dependent protease